MIRSLLLMMAAILSLGTTCTPPLVCSNSLDGTDLGFTAVIPTDFTCSASLPAPASGIRGFVIYEQAQAGLQLLVFVVDPAASQELIDGGSTDGPTCDDIGPATTANGIEFQRCKSVNDTNGATSFAASADLTSGDLLLIILLAEADSAELEGMLNDILDTVQFP